MSEDQGKTHDDLKKAQRSEHQPARTGAGLLGLGLAPSYSTSLLGDPRLNGRGNSSVKAAVMLQMQQTYGNRAVQRWLAAQPSIQRVNSRAAAEASNSEPDNSTQLNDNVGTLSLAVDVETLDRNHLRWTNLKKAEVGHAWIQVKWNLGIDAVPNTLGESTKKLLKSPARETKLGFWPLVHRAEDWVDEGKKHQEERAASGWTPGAGASEDPQPHISLLNPGKYVPGRVEEPDDEHSPKIRYDYPLTMVQFDNLMAYVASNRSAEYSLLKYNCTTFVVEAAKAAGQSPPSGMKMGVAFPNALYNELYKLYEKDKSKGWVKPLGADETHGQDRSKG